MAKKLKHGFNTKNLETEKLKDKGQMVDYKVTDISEHMSFLEMMDVLNEQL